jgi:hypothetical protein
MQLKTLRLILGSSEELIDQSIDNNVSTFELSKFWASFLELERLSNQLIFEAIPKLN